MIARRATTADLDWIVDVLQERRAPLAQHAPIYWRPAPDARRRHRAFIEYLLTTGWAYRTADSVLIAAPRDDGWLVDDAFVRGERWLAAEGGKALWRAFADDCDGAPVRFVCPVFERERAEFAAHVGLSVLESWWLMELPGAGGQPGVEVDLPGVRALTVAAPPVYAPPGPVLFLSAPDVVETAIPAALAKAEELGCSALVVSQGPESDSLESYGLRRNCDFFAGTVHGL